MNYYVSDKAGDSTAKKHSDLQITLGYVECIGEVNRICAPIKILINDVGRALNELARSDQSGKLAEQYKYCLKHTVATALDEVDKFIDKHPVASDREAKFLRDIVINLLDDVELIFNQD